MKLLIFLKVGDPNPNDKKLKKNDLYILEEMARLLAIKQFKKELSKKPAKVLKEYPTDASVLIDFDGDENDISSIYDSLRTISVVDIIDSIIPKD